MPGNCLEESVKVFVVGHVVKQTGLKNPFFYLLSGNICLGCSTSIHPIPFDHIS